MKTSVAYVLAVVLGVGGSVALQLARVQWGDGVLFWFCVAATILGAWQVLLGWRDIRTKQLPAKSGTDPKE